MKIFRPSGNNVSDYFLSLRIVIYLSPNLKDHEKENHPVRHIVVYYFCSSFGQNVSYAYDEAGNRVKREIVLQTRAAEEFTNESYSEMLEDRGIRIYPNPTEGQLTVEITGDGACRFDIYNISGQQVLTTNSGPGRVALDISSQPKGLYILRVTTEMVAILLLGR